MDDWWKKLAATYRFDPVTTLALGSIDTGFTSVAAGLSVTEAFNDPEKSFAARLEGEKRFGFAPLPRIIRHTLLSAHDFGGDVRLPSSPLDQAMKVVAHPVSDESGVLALKAPDPKTAGGIETAMQFSRLQHQIGGIVWFHHRSPFTMAANICGMEWFGRWMIRKPDLCDHLIDMALDHIFNVLDYWIDTFGSQNIAVYNSSPMESNQLISPKHFERFALPSHQKYINRLNQSGITRYFFHVCGEQNRNLPYLSGIADWHHPAIISIGHEVEISVAARFFPEDIIYGNIDPQIIQSESPQKIDQICQKTLEQGKTVDAGFILALGCDLPVFAPVENVSAMKQTVTKFRKSTFGF